MALMNDPFKPPLQFHYSNENNNNNNYSNNNYSNNNHSKPAPGNFQQEEKQEEKKDNNNNNNNNNNDNNDSDELQVLPLRIFGDNASKFMCEQCTNVPLKVAACNAGHIFCRKCIEDLYNNKQLCPVDQTPITKPSFDQVVLDNLVKREKVHCLYGGRYYFLFFACLRVVLYI